MTGTAHFRFSFFSSRS